MTRYQVLNFLALLGSALCGNYIVAHGGLTSGAAALGMAICALVYVRA